MSAIAPSTQSENHGESPACHLADYAPGSRVTVVGVGPNGLSATARRLLALGFTPGSEVTVVRRAPLGCPVVYRVKDYEICLRREQAAQIRVAKAA